MLPENQVYGIHGGKTLDEQIEFRLMQIRLLLKFISIELSAISDILREQKEKSCNGTP